MNKIIRFIKQKPFLYGGIVILILLVAWGGYLRIFQHREWAAWTGFGARTNPKGEFQPAKTLWDFLELLIIPIALAITAYLFTKSENNRQREFELEKIRETAFQEYLSQIDDLIKSGLVEKGNDTLRAIARSRTLGILKMLDGKRKGLVIRYLNELGLIHNAWKDYGTAEEGDTYYPTIINLMGADLSYICFLEPVSENYPETIWEYEKTGFYLDLSKMNLSSTNLSNANFYGVDLNEVSFRSSNLFNADFSFSRGSNVNFSNTNLENTKFFYCYFWLGNFTNANLTNAQIIHADFNGAKFFNNGKELEEEFSGFANLNNTIIHSTNFFGADITPEQINAATKVTNVYLPSNALHNKEEPLFIWQQNKTGTKTRNLNRPVNTCSILAFCPLCQHELAGAKKFRDFWDSFELHLQESHGKPKKGL